MVKDHFAFCEKVYQTLLDLYERKIPVSKVGRGKLTCRGACLENAVTKSELVEALRLTPSLFFPPEMTYNDIFEFMERGEYFKIVKISLNKEAKEIVIPTRPVAK